MNICDELKDLYKCNWKIIKLNEIKTDYVVSDTGLVYSLKSNKILKPDKSNCGYLRVRLYTKKYSGKKSIHRLVALAFIENPELKPQVNHKDGDKCNNRVTNLEWNTASENDKHAYQYKLKRSKVGDESHFAKYERDTVIYSCELMESGIYTLREISNMTGIDIAMIYRIYWRISWMNVSIEYDVENALIAHNKYTIEQIEHVFALLEEDKLSIYDISDTTGVKTSTIYNILIKRYVENYEYLYEVYDITKYHRNKKMEDFSDSAKEFILSNINDNVKTKYIIDYIHDEYGYNKDRIRHYIQRVKHKRFNDYRKHNVEEISA